jgi:hypothetical protein
VDDELEGIPEAMAKAAAGMMVKARSARTERLATFAAAKRHPHGTIILRSTMTDHPYVVCDGAMVACDEDTLWQLLSDLDHVIWSDGGEAMPLLAPGDRLDDGGPSGGAKVTYAALTYDDDDDSEDGGVTAGGMWVHPDFHVRDLTDIIADVIEGKVARLGLTEVPATPDDAEITW